MDEAEALCDRVGIIQDGRLLALDSVAKLRSDHGFEFKVTYYPNGSTEGGQTLYGADDRELVSRVREMGFQQFSVARTTLEDVYLALTGGMEGFDDEPR
jgi:ABC-2 type transport system ATP-binding protein